MSDKIIINDKTFNVVSAITEEEQERGLMFKPWPPPIMIFPFDSCAIRKFWMSNTISPLDIVFCKNGKIIDICEGEPLSYKLIGPNIKTNLVLEFPRNMTKTSKICVGDYVKVIYSVISIAKKFGSI